MNLPRAPSRMALIRVALTVRARSPNQDERSAGRQSSNRRGFDMQRELDEVALRKLRDRPQGSEVCGRCEFREHGTVSQTILEVVG